MKLKPPKIFDFVCDICKKPPPVHIMFVPSGETKQYCRECLGESFPHLKSIGVRQ